VTGKAKAHRNGNCQSRIEPAEGRPDQQVARAMQHNRKPKAADPAYSMIAKHMALSVAFEATPNGALMLELQDRAKQLWHCQPVSLAGASALLRYISTLPDWQLGPDFGELSDIPLLKALCKESASALDQVVR
jgi:hypothetical protein